MRKIDNSYEEFKIGKKLSFDSDLKKNVRLIENILIDWLKDKYNIKTKEIIKIVELINSFIENINKELSNLLFNSKIISKVKSEKVIFIINKLDKEKKLEF
jgi:hypothetical protein